MKTLTEVIKLAPDLIKLGVGIARAVKDKNPRRVDENLRNSSLAVKARQRARKRWSE